MVNFVPWLLLICLWRIGHDWMVSTLATTAAGERCLWDIMVSKSHSIPRSFWLMTHLPCDQCTETFSHVSFIQSNTPPLILMLVYLISVDKRYLMQSFFSTRPIFYSNAHVLISSFSRNKIFYSMMTVDEIMMRIYFHGFRSHDCGIYDSVYSSLNIFKFKRPLMRTTCPFCHHHVLLRIKRNKHIPVPQEYVIL